MSTRRGGVDGCADKPIAMDLVVLTESGRHAEHVIALAHLEKHKDKPQLAFEDIVWALVNTKEFLFNH